MRGSLSRLLLSLAILGVVVEINTAYKRAIGLPVEAMGGVPIQRIPRAFRDSLTEIPMVRQFDGMTMTSGTMVSLD